MTPTCRQQPSATLQNFSWLLWTNLLTSLTPVLPTTTTYYSLGLLECLKLFLPSSFPQVYSGTSASWWKQTLFSKVCASVHVVRKSVWPQLPVNPARQVFPFPLQSSPLPRSLTVRSHPHWPFKGSLHPTNRAWQGTHIHIPTHSLTHSLMQGYETNSSNQCMSH